MVSKQQQKLLNAIPEAGNIPEAEIITASEIKPASEIDTEIIPASDIEVIPEAVKQPAYTKVYGSIKPIAINIEATEGLKPASIPAKKPKRNLKKELRELPSDTVTDTEPIENFLRVRLDIGSMINLSAETLEHIKEECNVVVKELTYKVSINSLELGNGITEADKILLEDFENERLLRYTDLLKDRKIDTRRYKQLCEQFPKTPLVLTKNKYFKVGRGKLRKEFTPDKLLQFALSFGFKDEKKTQALLALFKKLESDKCIGSVRVGVLKEIQEVANYSKEYQKIHGKAFESQNTVLSENETQIKLKVRRFMLRMNQYKYRMSLVDYILSLRSGVTKTEAVETLAKNLGTNPKKLRKFILSWV